MTFRHHVTRMHHRVMHALPFVPSRKRKRGFQIVRRWGKWILKVEALETLNHYDLITLLLLSRSYLEGDFQDLGVGNDDRRRVRIRLDVERLTRERGLLNKKVNRMTFIKSLLRFKKCDLEFSYPEDGEVISSWFLSDVKFDPEGRWAEVDANAKFLSMCAKGIVVHWKRLASYGDDACAVILDAYLQGTKRKVGKTWKYRDWISEEEVFDLIDPDHSNPNKKNRQLAKNAFRKLEQAGLPSYRYDRVGRRWCRADFLDGRGEI